MTDQTSTVTTEAAQDFKHLIAGMTDDQCRRFLLNSILANDATSLTVQKGLIVVDDNTFEDFTLRFLKDAHAV